MKYIALDGVVTEVTRSIQSMCKERASTRHLQMQLVVHAFDPNEPEQPKMKG